MILIFSICNYIFCGQSIMMTSRSMLICNNKNYSFIHQHWHYLHGALGISVCNKYRSTAALYRSVGKLIVFQQIFVFSVGVACYTSHCLTIIAMCWCVCMCYIYVCLSVRNVICLLNNKTQISEFYCICSVIKTLY